MREKNQHKSPRATIRRKTNCWPKACNTEGAEWRLGYCGGNTNIRKLQHESNAAVVNVVYTKQLRWLVLVGEKGVPRLPIIVIPEEILKKKFIHFKILVRRQYSNESKILHSIFAMISHLSFGI